MSIFSMSHEVAAAVANTSPHQTWMFVCDSRKQSAKVVEAHISADIAKRRARAIGGCMRVGRVVNGKAETI